MAENKIRETRAKLQKNMAELPILEENFRILVNEVKNLKDEYDFAKKAYIQCLTGKR